MAITSTTDESNPVAQAAHAAALAAVEVRWGTLGAVVVPFLGLVIAMYGLWGWGFSWVDLSTMLAMYIVTGLGITVGYHRLFTHRAFKTVRPIKILLAIIGSMAVQGPLLFWVATHRKHHQHSDSEGDPHSPHGYGRGVLAVLAGWWHAHIGWMFKTRGTGFEKYVKDFRDDKALQAVSKLFVLWVAIGLLIPAAVGGLLSWTWQGVLLGFLWGGLVRVFLLHHVTWSINSVCHLWGTRPFTTTDESRNNALWGLFAFGEGWHNNHHHFPSSARLGLRWWQFDMGWIVICVLKWLGLAWGIRVPGRSTIGERRPTPV